MVKSPQKSNKDLENIDAITSLWTAQPSASAPTPPAPKFAAEKPRRDWRPMAIAGVLLLALIGGAVFAARRLATPTVAPAGAGTLAVSTNPAGAQVIVDGEARGVTPLTLTLNAGAHVMVLRGAGMTRSIPVAIAAGTAISQYIELPRSGLGSGQLQVRTEPAGAKVTIDGELRGVAPLTISSLAPGEHNILLENDVNSVKQTVTIEAGATASLVVPLSAPEGAPVSGWIAVSSPVPVELYENGRLLGTSQSERLMVSAGRHEITVANDALGYRFVRTVQVPAGKIAPIKIELPKGSMAINAVPWAEVWVDGERIGETPIGNLSLSIGPHDVVFRHPDFGEQHQIVTVTLSSPARLSVDLRKK